MYKKLSYLYFSDLDDGDIAKLKDVTNNIYILIIVGKKLSDTEREVFNIKGNIFESCRIVIKDKEYYFIDEFDNYSRIEIKQIKKFINFIDLITDYNVYRWAMSNVKDINIHPDLESYDKVIMTKSEIEKALGYEIIIKEE